jgi:hypothetical protein
LKYSEARDAASVAVARAALPHICKSVVARFGKVAVAARAAAERAQRVGALTAGVAGGEPGGEVAQDAASGGGGDAHDAFIESEDDGCVDADDVASEGGYDSPAGGSGGGAQPPAVSAGRVTERAKHYELLDSVRDAARAADVLRVAQRAVMSPQKRDRVDAVELQAQKQAKARRLLTKSLLDLKRGGDDAFEAGARKRGVAALEPLKLSKNLILSHFTEV